MAKMILSAFSDEYADGLKEQRQALNGFGTIVLVNAINFCLTALCQCRQSAGWLIELRKEINRLLNGALS